MSVHDERKADADRVLRQLCEAILFEGLATKRGSSDVRARIEWSTGASAFRADVTMGGFGRPRIHRGPVMTRVGAVWRDACLDDLLDALEIADQIRTDLRADLARTCHLTELTHDTARVHGPRALLPYNVLESAIDEGHPYHPCFKARSGFSDADHLAFGPEAAAVFQLCWIAAARDIVDETLPEGFWPKEFGAARWRQLNDAATHCGIDLHQFALLPVHPWQMRFLRAQHDFNIWEEARKIMVLGVSGDSYHATQSVRTVINRDDPKKAHIKLSMAMRNSSSLRIIEPHSVCVAPAISDWLSAVIESDPLYKTDFKLTVLREYAGIIVGRETSLSGHLAALFRQSPESIGLSPNALLPFNALAVLEPDERPLIDGWIAKHGAKAWLDQLLTVSILPIWHLMVAHGLGLEAHAQNLLLEHDAGWPLGLVARDFHESLEYVPPLLSLPELAPDLGGIDPAYRNAAPDRFHLMQSAEELRELVMDTLFIYNLAELSALFARFYALPEGVFWFKVRALLDDYASRYGMDERQALFAPFTPEIQTESLLTHKISGGRQPCRHTISNALFHRTDSA